MKLPRSTLALRISALAAAVAVITAVLAGLFAVRLVERSNANSARETLSRLADAAQQAADAGDDPQAGQNRARRTLQALKIQSAAISETGTVRTGSALAKSVLTPADISAVLGGGSVSAQRPSGGHQVLIEGRRTNAGGLALVQRQADATAAGDRTIRRIEEALAMAVVIAIVLGLIVAIRISRPLQHTAAAAHALAAGQRDVRVSPRGPTEVAEVGRALNTLATALSHSEQRQREFLLSVSHDLRTPLTAITGYAESLADGIVPPEQAPRIGSILLSESHRLNRLVADLLDLARLQAQDFRIEPVEVDAVGLCRDAAGLWAGRCAAAGIAFSLQAPDRALRLLTDPVRVRQITDGLLENALRVTPSGAPIVLAVRREVANDGRPCVVFEVRDGGPGLTDADLPVAFERSVLHERYRGVRQVGTGLGLAIVAGLTERLGGTAEAGHAPEGGARFTVRLPAEDAYFLAPSTT